MHDRRTLIVTDEMEVGGVLRIRHTGTTQVAIVKRARP